MHITKDLLVNNICELLSWWQILLTGLIGAIITLIATAGVTIWTNKQTREQWAQTEKVNAERWSKEFYKNFECEFWLKFYKNFHILRRFMLPLLKNIIMAEHVQHFPFRVVKNTVDEKKYFNDWLEYFHNMYHLINGYEDLYLAKYQFDISSIWIVSALRLAYQEKFNEEKLKFEKNTKSLPQSVYREMYEHFRFTYWEDVRVKNPDEILEALWNKNMEDLDYKKLYRYFEEKINAMDNKLKQIVNSEL